MLQDTFMRQSFCRLIPFYSTSFTEQRQKQENNTRKGWGKNRIKNEKLQIGREVVAATLRGKERKKERKSSIRP